MISSPTLATCASGWVDFDNLIVLADRQRAELERCGARASCQALDAAGPST
jgi:hypothetical protein